VRRVIHDLPHISERRMFGGLAFMAGPNMFCGVMGEGLLVRVGAERHGDALRQPGVRVMDFTGRPMRAFVVVGSPGIDSDEDLRAWVKQAYEFASTLPPGKRRRRGL
jgi:hypothetical protein